MFAEGGHPIVVAGAGDEASGAILLEALAAAPPYSTIYISGSFEVEGSVPLCVPLRLVGPVGATAQIRMERGALLVSALAFIERVAVVTWGPSPFNTDGTYDIERFCPAVEVTQRALCVLDSVHATSSIGTALLVDEHARVFATGCALESSTGTTRKRAGQLCLGVLGKRHSVLSMYGSRVSRCRWGAFGGAQAHASRLLENNVFSGCVEDIAHGDQYPDLTGQVVQPWGAWHGVAQTSL